MTLSSILLILAAACFLGGTVELQTRVNLVALGLFLAALAIVLRDFAK